MLRGETLATLGAPVGEHCATADGRHAGAETMAPLADQLGRLIGALHGCTLLIELIRCLSAWTGRRHE